MNKYFKMRISLKEYPDKLYREILCGVDTDLDELAFSILSMFNTMYYHSYEFKDNSCLYACESFIEQLKENGVSVGKTLSSFAVPIKTLDIPELKFLFIYDFGENYIFNIEIISVVELKQKYNIPVVIDGRGLGIVEDNKTGLLNYLKGTNKKPLYFYYKSRFKKMQFVRDFDIDDCNKNLKKYIARIRQGYYSALTDKEVNELASES